MESKKNFTTGLMELIAKDIEMSYEIILNSINVPEGLWKYILKHSIGDHEMPFMLCSLISQTLSKKSLVK